MEYQGEQHGIYLARVLNRDARGVSSVLVKGSTTWQSVTHSVRPPTRATARRIEELVELMRGALAELNSNSPHDSAWKALLRRLGPYRFRVFPMTVGDGTLAPLYELIGASLDESEAIFSLFELCRNGQVDRLRRCAWCNRWFFARFAHQTHCPGGECRKAEISKSPRWKEYRKKKSKAYYWDKKSGRNRREK